MAFLRVFAPILAAALAGCATGDTDAGAADPVTPVSTAALDDPGCPSGGSRMTSVTLFFGMAIPGGGKVSDGEWRSFLDTEVTPRFPDGLSVLQAAGQWKDSSSGAVVRENSRALLIWTENSPGASAEIDAIRDAYKERFSQDSVMRVDDLDCVDF